MPTNRDAQAEGKLKLCHGCGEADPMIHCVNCKADYCKRCAAWCHHSHTERLPR